MIGWRWIRGMLRRNTAPMTVEQAAAWKEKISVIYCVLSVNAFIGVIYACKTGKADWPKYFGLKSEAELARSPAYQWADLLQIDNAKVYRISSKGLEERFDTPDGKKNSSILDPPTLD